MKFSSKLFKIQAKMSLPAFILMGSVCHLGAMEDDLANGDLHSADEVGVRIPNNGLARVLQEYRDGQKAKNKGEDSQSSGRFEKAFKGSEMLSGYNDERSEDCGLKKTTALSQEERRKTDVLLKVAGRKGTVPVGSSIQEKVFQDPSGSPMLSTEGVYANLSSPQCDGSELLSSKEFCGTKLTSATPIRSVGSVEEADEEVTSPGVLCREEMERNAAMGTSADSDIVLRRERLDFGDVSQELAVQDGNALTLFDRHSIFAASLEDQVTLRVGEKEVVTTIGAVLTKNDTSEASSVLKYHVHYAEYNARDEKKRKKYLKDLLELPGYSEHKLNIDTVLPFLIGRVLSSSSFLPSFFKSSVQKLNHSAALIQRSMDEAHGIFARVSLMSQQNSMLRNQNLALVQTLRQAFNSSELSEMFASDSKEVIRFDTNDWSPEQFSACLQLIVNQLLESQKSNSVLSKAQEKLSTAQEKIAASNEELSGTVRDLSKAGVSASATIQQLTAEKAVLDAKIESMRAEQEGWPQKNEDTIQQALSVARAAWEKEKQDAIEQAVIVERAAQANALAVLNEEVVRLRGFKKKILSQLTQQQGNSWVTDLLKKVNK